MRIHAFDVRAIHCQYGIAHTKLGALCSITTWRDRLDDGVRTASFKFHYHTNTDEFDLLPTQDGVDFCFKVDRFCTIAQQVVVVLKRVFELRI